MDAPTGIPPIDLRGPAVTNGQLEAAVVTRLHAAGSAGFEWLARRVDPDIAAGNQHAGRVNVVVRDNCHPTRNARIALQPLKELLEDLLAGFVTRMGLPGDHELNRPFRVAEDRRQPVKIAR